MAELCQGTLSKMSSRLAEPVQYELRVGEHRLPLNERLGQHIRLVYTGRILCTHCGRLTKKSFNQGYCYPCFTRLAQCDSCIMSPEKCHYAEGTCREPAWGEANCMIDHIVYLANSSGVKVGITRHSQIPTRWIDQGAIQALPIFRVQTRQQSGLLEAVLRQHVTDRTNWRAMLKGAVDPLDLQAERDRLLAACAEETAALQQRFGLQAIATLPEAEVLALSYPVINHPSKVTSLDFEKQPVVEGTLLGIKGQYLVLDTGVINIRKYTAYEVTASE